MSKTTEDTRSYAELAELVRAGDNSITPEMLSQARERDELVRLHAEADERARQERAQAEYEAALARVRERIDALPNITDRIRELTVTAATALAGLAVEVRARGTEIDGIAQELRQLGVAASDNSRGVRSAGGLSWRRPGGYSGDVELVVDGRTVRTGSPARFLARAVIDGRVAAGIHPEELRNLLDTTPAGLDDLVAAMDVAPKPPEPLVTIRWIRDSGRQVETLKKSYADNWVRRGLAEYVR